MGHTAPTKTTEEIWNTYTLLSNEETQDSGAVDFTTALGGEVSLIATGGTGDTAQPRFECLVSPDNVNWYNKGGKAYGFGQFSGSPWDQWQQRYTWKISPGAGYVKIRLYEHAWGNSWTIRAWAAKFGSNM